MELLIDQRAPESLADTGHIRFFGDTAELSTANLRLVVHNAYRMTRGLKSQFLWVFVGNLFGVGSRSAINICVTLGLDPSQELKDVQW